MSAQPETANKHVRPFYWSVRRELWENRSLYLAPLIVERVQAVEHGHDERGKHDHHRGH